MKALIVTAALLGLFGASAAIASEPVSPSPQMKIENVYWRGYYRPYRWGGYYRPWRYGGYGYGYYRPYRAYYGGYAPYGYYGGWGGGYYPYGGFYSGYGWY